MYTYSKAYWFGCETEMCLSYCVVYKYWVVLSGEDTIYGQPVYQNTRIPCASRSNKGIISYTYSHVFYMKFIVLYMKLTKAVVIWL